MYVGSVTKKRISQNTCPKDRTKARGNASAWSAQAARNAPLATVRDITVALQNKSGKAVTKTEYVWNARLRNAQAIAKKTVEARCLP